MPMVSEVHIYQLTYLLEAVYRVSAYFFYVYHVFDLPQSILFTTITCFVES